MKTCALVFSAVAFFAFAMALLADVSLAAPFGSNAVIQRDKPIPVWGQADPGEKVTVQFGSRAATTTTADDGSWRVTLGALPTSATPLELIVTGKNQVVFTNILIGDVWLCGGQSNMEWNVARTDSAAAEVAAADHPGIRYIKIDRAIASVPTARATGAWRLCTPREIGSCSAVAYFFARDINRETGVPIGIIQSSWSGAMIESFMPPATLAAPAFPKVARRWDQTLAAYPRNKEKYDTDLVTWEKEREAAAEKGVPFNKPAPREPVGIGHRDEPSGIYNAMVAPLAPAGLRGFLWYQGESNAHRFDEYRELFTTMILSWRAAFQQGELPFYWVQLPNYKAGRGTARMRAFLREAQDQTLALSNTGQAVTIDIGNPDDEHPTNKQEVGRRLALIALKNVYGKAVDCHSPHYVSARTEGNAMHVILSREGGLTVRGTAAPSFEVAAADGIFHPATARIEGKFGGMTLVVSSTEVKAPVAVRYAWFNDPVANLYNAAGLPLTPFRSDEWESGDVSRISATIPQDKAGRNEQKYFMDKHAAFLARAKEGPVDLLFIGDSITDGWNKVPDIWEKYYGKYSPANFGISGDSTQQVLWRIAQGELDNVKPKVVVLMIGTNNTGTNTPAEIAEGIGTIIRRIHQKIPETKVLLLAVFPRGPRTVNGVHDDAINRMIVINDVNARLARMADGMRIQFLDINKVFLGPDGKIPDDVMPDQLHPGSHGYQLWAEAMQPKLEKMMGGG